MTQITRLPGMLNIKGGKGDTVQAEVEIRIDGAPANISAWTFAATGCTATVTDAAQGKLKLDFESSQSNLQRWSLTRTSAPIRRLLAGFAEYVLDGGPSTAAGVTVNLVDDEATVQVIISEQTLPAGGSTGAVLAKISAADGDAGWTREPSLDKIRFATSGESLDAPGELAWRDLDEALAYRANGIEIPIGQESVVYVRNPPNAGTIPKGAVVAVEGASSNRLQVQLCDATAGANLGCRTLGVAIQAISSPGFGFVSTFGLLRGFNTNNIIGGGVTEGSELFISSTPGVLSTQPQASPGRRVTAGYVVTTGGNGSIFVTIRRGLSVNELDDVSASTQAEGDILYRTATRWERLAAGPEGSTLTIVSGKPAWVV